MVRQSKNQPQTKTPRQKQQNVFQAEAIKDVAFVNGIPYYRVKWSGYSEKENTWEPIEHLTNFKDQVKKIHKKKSVIKNFDSLKNLYLNKPMEQIQVKTEETVKRMTKTGKSKPKQIKKKISKKQKTPTTIVMLDDSRTNSRPHEEEPVQLPITRVLDLQQVYHQQTRRIYILAKVLRKTKKNREVESWAHLQELKKTRETLLLLTDFLLDNVQFESKVIYVDDNDSDQEFKGINFHQ